MISKYLFLVPFFLLKITTVYSLQLPLSHYTQKKVVFEDKLSTDLTDKMWKENNDNIKKARIEYDKERFPKSSLWRYECLYCCLAQGNYRSVWKNMNNLKNHQNSFLHKRNQGVVGKSKRAQEYYKFLSSSKQMSPKEMEKELLEQPYVVRSIRNKASTTKN